MKKAFTLIELLIVVAIIAILAAIAVPNFLEAQVRAKVSRAKNDMRALATAVESYAVDHNIHPTYVGNGLSGMYRPNRMGPAASYTIGYELTTPIAYLTSLAPMLDVFKIGRADIKADPTLIGRDHINWVNWRIWSMHNNGAQFANVIYTGTWAMWSAGPDRYTNNTTDANPQKDFSDTSIPRGVNYDPTNGTVSNGDIYRTQLLGDGMKERARVP